MTMEYSNNTILFYIYIYIYIYIYTGCYKGWWVSDCSKPCPATCVDRHCYPGNGNCVWGCTIGQDGDNCDRRNV